MTQDKTERPPGKGHIYAFVPAEDRRKTEQRSVKARVWFMTKTWYIKTLTTASEACVSRLVAHAHFRLCHLICTVGGGGRAFSLCSVSGHRHDVGKTNFAT